MDDKVQSIFNAADSYVMLIREWPERPDLSDAEGTASWRDNMGQRKEYTAIFRRGGHNDRLANNIDTIVGEFETQVAQDAKSALGGKLRKQMAAIFDGLSQCRRKVWAMAIRSKSRAKYSK